VATAAFGCPAKRSERLGDAALCSAKQASFARPDSPFGYAQGRLRRLSPQN